MEIDCWMCLLIRQEETEAALGVNKPQLSLLLYWKSKGNF